jgi:hypothetical protein
MHPQPEGRQRHARPAKRRVQRPPYTCKGRFIDETGQSGTSPEERIAAAHAGCFAMHLSHFLAENGTPPDRLDVQAAVKLIPAPTSPAPSSEGLGPRCRPVEIPGTGGAGEGCLPGLEGDWRDTGDAGRHGRLRAGAAADGVNQSLISFSTGEGQRT